MARLDGRVAIVTGGAKGIGRHYAKALAAEGARLMIADLADGKDVANEIARDHGANSVASAVTDVGEEGAVKALVAQTMERFGKIDVLVNNAALFAPLKETKCTEIDAALWDRVMAINLRGPFLMVKHVAPHMTAQGYGKIINIGSGTAFKGTPNLLHYVASKGAVVSMTRSIARELGPHNICVNAIAPGLTMSEAVVTNPDWTGKASVAGIAARAIQREQVPADLISTLIYFCSDESNFVTGQTVSVDGGALMR